MTFNEITFFLCLCYKTILEFYSNCLLSLKFNFIHVYVLYIFFAFASFLQPFISFPSFPTPGLEMPSLYYHLNKKWLQIDYHSEPHTPASFILCQPASLYYLFSYFSVSLRNGHAQKMDPAECLITLQSGFY